MVDLGSLGCVLVGALGARVRMEKIDTGWVETVGLAWFSSSSRRLNLASSRLAAHDRAGLALGWLNAINPSRFSASWKWSSGAGYRQAGRDRA